jgi:hypothetical protein
MLGVINRDKLAFMPYVAMSLVLCNIDELAQQQQQI